MPEYRDVLDEHLANHFSKPVYKKQMKICLRNSLKRSVQTRSFQESHSNELVKLNINSNKNK